MLSKREQRKKVYDQIHAAAQRKGKEQLRLAMAELCRTDLFYLLTVAIGRQDIDRDWLFDRCNEIQANPDGNLDLWAREHYKAVDINEPVPTPNGWKAHGELQVGDEVFGPDGLPTTVIAKTQVFTEADCYFVEFDDYEVVVSGDHLWEVERLTRKRKKGAGRLYRERAVVSTRELARLSHEPDNRLAVRVSEPLQLSAKSLPITPYVLGVWLGDGARDCGRITSGDPEVFASIEQDGYALSKPHGKQGLARTVYGLQPELKKLGLLPDKFVPEIYKRAGVEQRRALLAGLMDSDGHVNTRGTATFVNKDRRLSFDVFELAASLGLKPRFRVYPYGHGDVYHVSFQAYKSDAVFRIPRKADRQKNGSRCARRFIKSVTQVESVPVSCIQVARDDGLYLIGKAMVTTHNSTIITFGKTIQDILCNPEITVGIFSHTKPIAKAFLRQIKYELETNERLKYLFPDVLWANPKKEAPQWSEDKGITVKRKTNPKEGTVEAHGLVDGQPTSKHYSLLVYDDVVTLESVSTPEMIEKVTNAWALSLNLGAHGGAVRYIGTRYHFNDTYKPIMDRRAALPRLHPATDDGTPTGNPVFLSREVLEKKRREMGPYVFACQMLQNPKADEAQGFLKDWLRFYDREPDPFGMNIYILVDPANEKRKKSDYTVMWVIGLGPDRNYYAFDLVRDRMNLTERTNMLFRLHQDWHPVGVGYEQYGMQADIQHIESVQERRNYRFNITPLGGQMSKVDRIRQLIPLFEQGRIWLPRNLYHTNYEGQRVNMIRQFIDDEYIPFPVMLHDDMLDGLARIVDPELAAAFPKFKERKKKKSWRDNLRKHLRGVGNRPRGAMVA